MEYIIITAYYEFVWLIIEILSTRKQIKEEMMNRSAKIKN